MEDETTYKYDFKAICPDCKFKMKIQTNLDGDWVKCQNCGQTHIFHAELLRDYLKGKGGKRR